MEKGLVGECIGSEIIVDADVIVLIIKKAKDAAISSALTDLALNYYRYCCCRRCHHHLRKLIR